MGEYYQGRFPSAASLPSYDGLLGADETGAEPEPWERYGLAGWGAYSDAYDRSPRGGIIDAEYMGLAADVDTEAYGGLARTPMMELAPRDYEYMQRVGAPYDGMMGLCDDGQVVVYDGLAGFFKKLFRRVRRGIKKVAKRIRKVARKIISKIPGGKMLLKIGGKIRKIAMKVVKPLTKFIGKYAGKLAPIAAFVPGYGPAIAAGLRVAGKVARTARKFMGVPDQSPDLPVGGPLRCRIPRHLRTWRGELRP